MNELSTLLIFKLADMINIALEEGTYYKKQDWCWDNSYKYLVESDPHKWNTTFLEAMEKFGRLDYI